MHRSTNTIVCSGHFSTSDIFKELRVVRQPDYSKKFLSHVADTKGFSPTMWARFCHEVLDLQKSLHPSRTKDCGKDNEMSDHVYCRWSKSLSAQDLRDLVRVPMPLLGGPLPERSPTRRPRARPCPRRPRPLTCPHARPLPTGESTCSDRV